ncbi:MAG: hypothetical protein QNJ62_06265 [Methyloceanibacter sp.]|nr:hypothetical protein [Methyloceanibacter sp.]
MKSFQYLLPDGRRGTVTAKGRYEAAEKAFKVMYPDHASAIGKTLTLYHWDMPAVNFFAMKAGLGEIVVRLVDDLNGEEAF